MSEERVPLSIPHLGGSALKYVQECIETGWVSSAGPFVGRFEDAVRAYTGSTGAVATTNGTAALHLAYILAGIQPGDVVLAPTLSFIATVNPLRYAGATPWFVDVDAASWNVDAKTIHQALLAARAAGHHPKHVVVTHLYGVPVDMGPVMDLCQAEGLVLVEDAAESLGSFLHGRHTGTFGRTAALSFNGNKIITTGGGGMVMCRDPALAARAKHLSTQARPDARVYAHDDVGFNYRLTNIQAALGVSQMEDLPTLRDRRRAIQKQYRQGLADVRWLQPQHEPAGAESNGWLMGVRVVEGAPKTRDGLLAALDAAGIEARPVFQPIHAQPMYAACGGACPTAERISRECLNLPNSPTSDAARVLQAIAKV